jgi:hypothetical protein
MKAFLIFLSALALPAQAAVLGFVQSTDGSRIELHDDKGHCQGSALRASFVFPNGDRIGGCWTVIGPEVGVVFFDGDFARIPVQALKEPKPA